MAQVKDGVLISKWFTDDVFSLDHELTEEQAIEVFESVAKNFDAESGINWDVIQIHIDKIKGETS